MKLFERVIELMVGDTYITGLDIAFEIEKDLSPEPNSCHVEIFNLSPENRAILSKYDRVPVLIKAGYKDFVGLIFKGDMLSVRHLKEGPTWKTVLASGDGANAIQTSRTKKSYTKGTPVKTVIKDLAEQLKLPHDNALNNLGQFNNKLEKGFMTSGNVIDELNRLLASENMSASVQDGALQITNKGEAIKKEAISLSADSGLIAVEIGSKNEINLSCVLMPGLSPWLKIHIDSVVFKGFATIQSLRFSGANFVDEWGCEVAAVKN